ncbi:MAG: DNA primase [Planctomycetaceae bacterium]|nr:DNA primase [Planctomycetaceae bacterium]
MPTAFSADAKENVRRAVDIVDLVGHYVQLQRRGRLYLGLCPWHDDSHPSLQVNPERQSFKCWACNVGGDVFSFIMKIESVSFPEALRMLADRAGIQLEPQRGGAPSVDDELKRAWYQAVAWAERQFHELLTERPEGEAGRRYLADRGISPESIQEFQLGFAPDRWDWLLERARQTSFSPTLLEAVGLAVKRDQGSGHYDRFRGRVLFPIRDPQGRPVAFGGRILPELAQTTQAKYINSPETPLFSKSSMLYALDRSKDAISKSRTVVVVEGYTDVVVAHQYGLKNFVAVLGTALGERHMRLLRRYADQVVLVLDGDEAGQRRTNEILELFVAEQMDLRVLTLPDELDPCDFLLQRGGAALADLLPQGVDALEHHFALATQGLEASASIHQATQAAERVLATLARAPRLRADTPTAARVKEQQILHRLARRCGIAEEVLRDRLTALRRNTRRAPAALVAEPGSESPPRDLSLDPWERELLELLMRSPGAFQEVLRTIGPDDLRSSACRDIVLALSDLAEAEGEATFAGLLLAFDEPDMKRLLVDLDESDRTRDLPADEVLARLKSLMDSFARRQDNLRRRAMMTALEERRLGDDAGLDALRQLIQQEQNRQGISTSTDGPGCSDRSGSPTAEGLVDMPPAARP